MTTNEEIGMETHKENDDNLIPRKEEEEQKILGVNWSQSAQEQDPRDDNVAVELRNKRTLTAVKSGSKTTSKKSRHQNLPRIVYGLAWSQPYFDRIFPHDGTGTSSHNNEEFCFLATCAGRTVKVYRNYTNNTTIPLTISFLYYQTEEDFFCCEFVGHTDTANDDAVAECLCVAGDTGGIFVLNVVAKRLQRTLKGHGREVFDLKVHPVDGNLLLSASRDLSCRLWNVQLGSTIAIFGGDGGHLDAVNTISWHHSGQYFCSGGCDVAVKVWELTQTVKTSISASKRLLSDKDQPVAAKAPQLVQSGGAVVGVGLVNFPMYSTIDVHCRWVDCVVFVGDLIISKSAAGDISVWLPRIEKKLTLNDKPFQPPPSTATMLNSFSLPYNDYYFIKFAIDARGRFLAAGNQKGKIVVWNIESQATKPMSSVEVGRSHVIRNLAFSPDGAFLVVSTDAGAVFRFDVKEKARTL